MLYSSMWRVLLKATSYTCNTNTASLSYSKKFVGSYLTYSLIEVNYC